MPEIAVKLNMTIRGVEKNMKALKENGIVKRIGSNKAGTWEISQNNCTIGAKTK
jgi:ATP-dependent DNA helicase RecG